MLLGFLAVCLPFGLYCLIVARLNHHTHPVMVWGVWDFAGALFAVSGVLFFVGPGLITGFNPNWREVWLQINFRSLKGTDFLDLRWWIWTLTWYAYFVVIAAGAMCLLWRRRRVTAVYNVEPPILRECLGRALDRLGLSWVRAGDRFHIQARQATAESARRSVVPATVAVGVGMIHDAAETMELPEGRNGNQLTLDYKTQIVELSSFAATRHVTMYWPGDDSLRTLVEAELARVLAQVSTGLNPLVLWLRAIAAGLFLALLLLTAYVQIQRFRAGGF